MIYEYSLSAKWLELLKQIAPGVSRVAVIRNPENPVGGGFVQRHPSRRAAAWNRGEPD
jgi:putative ABC transport system substrate-binding protein